MPVLINIKENIRAFRRGMNPTLLSTIHRRHPSRIFNSQSSFLIVVLL